ncbi:PncC family amidohydrolase [Chryseobacterium bernardetii]|jgi:PncC family amidohydrolase|uniref:PncC family amidohydrolase n=1 Tax=Chryseobacterium bernardetii TaxID=1241978 RepID=A0ACC6IUN2_9FLAO|nr:MULTISPECIES: nicotinamide-nucleotide amidohydrolase family protein [Chryseobacterium]MBP1164622.1 PncC family amidohydrolase [Chryseobacterium sp. PvR013]MDR6370888.1 PncC family amidohydrolase [Chryseobacterium vietnamense]MDR6441366.1 PncC family amidohydrolase [Chryseobacterium bernardetii]MDR6461571.1 PncC family amidohydrolase [Chryseobacterium sediminis]
MILKSLQISEPEPVQSLICFMIELENLFEHIGEYLLSSGETVSTAESVTSGFLQFSFSQMKEASRFFKGGITAYTLREKVGLLSVNEDEARKYNCVSRQIAKTMALKVAALYKTDWSIGITGYALPVNESKGKLYCYFAIVYKGEVILSEKLDLHSRTKPGNAKLFYTEFVLGCFKLELDKYQKKNVSM